MPDYYEFGPEETQRIARSVIFTERFKARPRLYNNKFGFVLLENSTGSGVVRAKITSQDGKIEIASSAALRYKWGLLDGAVTGFTGECTAYDGTYYFDQCLVRPSIVHVNLTSNSHDWTAGDTARGFTVDQVTPITFDSPSITSGYPLTAASVSGITLTNPNNLNWIAGDKAVCRRVTANSYEIFEIINAICLRFRFVLTANAPNGLTPNITATAICPANSRSGQPPSGTLTLKDVFGAAHNAKTGHKGVAEFDYNNNWFYITECQHLSWKFRGKLALTLSGAAATMSVTPEYGIGPGALPSAPTTVHNRHGWESGAVNDVVRVEWNPELGQYEAYQLDCSE